MRRLVAGLLAVGLLAGCQQLEIDFTIRNTGTVTPTTVSLSGVMACSKGSPGIADKEPLDMFGTLTQGSHTVGVEVSDRCTVQPKVWTKTLDAPGFRKGAVLVELTVCTNPGLHIDEDCTSDTEVVTLS